jgi:hypothetical protein
MEQIIAEALFWKQLQIGAIASLLIFATVLSIWNLPWKAGIQVVSDKRKVRIDGVLSPQKREVLLQAHLYHDRI